jgi:hypothetical protein
MEVTISSTKALSGLRADYGGDAVDAKRRFEAKYGAEESYTLKSFGDWSGIR